MPTEQEKLIGSHPAHPNFFANWLKSEDSIILATKPNKKHRKLAELPSKRKVAIEQIAEWIIEHHVDGKKIKRLQDRKAEIMAKYGIKMEDYIDSQNFFPRIENTKSGNATEIILSRYLQETAGVQILAYKLTYNPNVDQSMKGDDCLLFDTKNITSRIIVGEAKYRAKPSKQTVSNMVKNLENSKRLPISLPFISTHLTSIGNEDLASQIDDLNFEVSKGRIPIINVGLLLSTIGNSRTTDAGICVEENLDSTNPNLVVLSLGVDKPLEIITEAFKLARAKLISQI
ncbi:Hachiman antiphage defense system protein HamA [Sphingobacterium siyangense]|uniref:Hachiman antiphage defense system protein HamA n=1 Tax=Sphingobacterium siyangense TaxID=459529 RepID=UPI0028B1CA44|nr:Hachiman antiphage defense system protein HamA [Sphingobacterium siyangense]